jgi:hypothetical protein
VGGHELLNDLEEFLVEDGSEGLDESQHDDLESAERMLSSMSHELFQRFEFGVTIAITNLLLRIGGYEFKDKRLVFLYAIEEVEEVCDEVVH